MTPTELNIRQILVVLAIIVARIWIGMQWAAARLAEEGAITVDVSHERMSLALNPKRAALDLVVELRDPEHGEKVSAVLRGGWVT